MPSEVVAQIETFRRELEAGNRTQALRMAGAWGSATQELEREYLKIAQEMRKRADRGLPVSIWHLQRLERYQTLLQQIDAKEKQLSTLLAGDITQAQATLARLGLSHSQAVIATLDGVAAQFDRLPYSAVANMVGNTGAGTPLKTLLQQSYKRNAGKLGDTLVRGTALGWHPTKTARAMRDVVNMNLTRSITIARTEQNRVYRTASQSQYKAARLVGYRRHADKGPRTCIACLMQDGKFYPIDVEFEEHVQGRCAMIPVRDPTAPPSWETGADWFERQDAATQRQILGPGRYAAWRNGQVQLTDMPERVTNPTWGNSWQVRSLRSMTGGPDG